MMAMPDGELYLLFSNKNELNSSQIKAKEKANRVSKENIGVSLPALVSSNISDVSLHLTYIYSLMQIMKSMKTLMTYSTCITRKMD